MKPCSIPARPQLNFTLSALAAVLLSGAITILSLWLQPNALRTVLSVFRAQPPLIILNALPVGLLVLVLAFLLHNVFYSAALINLAVCALSVANRIKLEVRDEPVFPRDLGLLRELGDAMGGYSIHYPWQAISLFAGFSIVLALLGILLPCKAFSPVKRRDRLVRLLGAGVSFGTLILLIFTVFASNILYNSFSVSNPYYVPSVFNELGFPYCFTHHFTTYSVVKPDDFSRSEAESWETPDTSGVGKRVHVIMVMNEAFSDLTDDPVFQYPSGEDPLPNLNALKSDGHAIIGHVVIPGFAGGTANTEFDVTTGMQTNALSSTTTSAFRAFNQNLDSLFRVFDGDGYHTSFFHPGESWFYNRENVYRYLGAQEILFASDMPDLTYKGRWVTDNSLAGFIEGKFEEAVSNGETLFNYITTIQNHMSYTIDKYGDDYTFPAVPVSVPLSDQAETLLKVYIEGTRDADAMLGRLVEYFSNTDEPVVLAFWGDHLPYLGDNQLAYRELGINFNDASEGASVLRSYETPYVIWANDAAADTLNWDQAVASLDLPDNHVISACFLGATVLELTGRGGENAWFHYLTEVRRELPVIQKQICLLPGGSMTSMRGLDADQSSLISKLRCWSYYKLKYKDVG